MSVIKDISRGIAPYAVLGGLALLVWVYRDAIAGWFQSAIAAPVTGAVSAVTAPIYQAGQVVADVVASPMPWIPLIPDTMQPSAPVSPGGANLTISEIISGFNPVTGAITAFTQLVDTLGVHAPIQTAPDAVAEGLVVETNASPTSYIQGVLDTAAGLVGPAKPIAIGENKLLGYLVSEGYRYPIVEPWGSSGSQELMIVSANAPNPLSLATGGIGWSAHDIVFGRHTIEWLGGAPPQASGFVSRGGY